MKIAKVQAREIFDSRGLPTLECQIFLDNGTSVLSSVPSGASKGIHEALELRDGGERLFGKGVLKAIEYIEETIAPELIGKKPDPFAMDRFMIELDGTVNKAKLGANTMLAVSMAIVKAQAAAEEMELYESIAHLYGAETVTLPYPLFNVINGGVHADNNLLIQEFLIMPVGGASFRESLEHAMILFHELKAVLKKLGKNIAVGDEGGFAASFSSELEALDLLGDVIARIGNGNLFAIALDVASSQFYDTQTQCYNWHDDFLTSEEMIKFYATLIQTYPIYSIEDGLSQDDWQGWIAMTKTLGDRIQLVGDDLFVTSVQRLKHGISVGAANAALIKPNQIGTVTETLEAIRTSSELGMNVIISHRSGETEDTFIADLAVGTSAGQIKAGGCSRSERLAKYNRLIRIEDSLLSGLMIELE
jgi:enolase